MTNFAAPGRSANADTIQKTLMTSLLFEGFWDRWIAHGIGREDAARLRPQLTGLRRWETVLAEQAEFSREKAKLLHKQGAKREAEQEWRKAGLYYSLIQWIYPETGESKRKWYEKSLESAQDADAVSNHKIINTVLKMDGNDCLGRIRIPDSPKGCVIMINPIDSAKEELFTYEADFANAGFATFNFDGPGQGGTYVFDGYKATSQRWSLFVDRLIDFAAEWFPELAYHLFGTSSGGAWALYGSAHPKAGKTVSVSPAVQNDVPLPEYFMERMSNQMEDPSVSLLPRIDEFTSGNSIMLFHGNLDVMVKKEDIYALIDKMPGAVRLVEYEKEGHCCNYKLNEIRQVAARWFLGEME